MKTVHTFLKLLIGCTLSLMAQFSSAQTYIDGPTTINYHVNGLLRLGFNNSNPFTVQMVEGGSVSGTVSVWNNCTFYVMAGNIGVQLGVRGNSQVIMSGGTVGNYGGVRDNAHFTFLGGVINGGYQSLGNGTFTMNGGTLYRAFFVTENSIFNYYNGAILGDSAGLGGIIQIYDNSTTNIYNQPPTNHIRAAGSSTSDDNGQIPLVNVYGTELSTETLDLEGKDVRIRGFSPYGEAYDFRIYTVGGFGHPDFHLVLHNIQTVTVSGQVTLQESVNLMQPITFEFHPTDGTPNLTRTVTLNQDGTFTLNTIPANTYTVKIKGAKWLAKSVTVDGTNGDVTGVNATLLAGDANNDNSVDVLDLDVLIQSFDATPDAPNWLDGAADFNCDASVDVLDLDLLIRNFDQTGDD